MFSIERSDEISERRDLAIVANRLGVVDMVEVGVDRASFAAEYLPLWKGRTAHLVDNYEPYGEMPWDRTLDMFQSVVRLSPWLDRVRFIRCCSLEAIELIPAARGIGWVYIDASHEYEDVIRDMTAWWDRLAPGGIFSGHDYDASHPDVMRAVEEFGREHDLTIRFTHETATPASWYAFKPVPLNPAMELPPCESTS